MTYIASALALMGLILQWRGTAVGEAEGFIMAGIVAALVGVVWEIKRQTFLQAEALKALGEYLQEKAR